MSERIVFVTGEPGAGPCTGCGAVDETRMGVCFGCATAGEGRAARRTVIQHLAQAVRNVARGAFGCARYDLTWAWERLTRTGDYAPGGEFERQYGVDR